MAAPTYRAGATYDSGGSQVLTVVLPKPTGTAADDILIAVPSFVFGLSADNRTISPPSGWTQLQQNGLDIGGGPYKQSTAVLWKLAGGSEPSDYTFTISNSDDSYAFGVIQAWQGGDTPEASDVLRTASTAANTLFHTPAVTGLGADRVDLRFILTMGNGVYDPHDPPSTYTSRNSEQQPSLNANLSSASKAQAASGNYGDQTFTIPGGGGVSGNAVGFSVVIPPPTAPTSTFIPQIVIM